VSAFRRNMFGNRQLWQRHRSDLAAAIPVLRRAAVCERVEGNGQTIQIWIMAGNDQAERLFGR
jgi:hypothetical protein